MNVRSMCSAVALGVTVMLLSWSGPGVASSAEVEWDDVKAYNGTVTFDRHGDTLIVGGTTKGPSARGGQAQWTTTVGSGAIGRLSVTVYTNGGRWYGKGAHARIPRGTIAMYVNGVAVHTLVCDTRGAYGDYWPNQAPAGSRSYSTGQIDVSGKTIQGPTLSIKLVAKPYTAIDVNAIEISTGE